jgi:hypothetical protein
LRSADETLAFNHASAKRLFFIRTSYDETEDLGIRIAALHRDELRNFVYEPFDRPAHWPHFGPARP